MPSFSVTRSIAINCSVAQLYAMLRDFRQWPIWSPWIILEPDCKLKFADDGTSYSWDGKIIGRGAMSVESEVENAAITCGLTFFKPWKSRSTVLFELSACDEGTELSWSMDGSLPFFIFWMKSRMMAYIGRDYERGLIMLKEYMETGVVPSKLNFMGEEPFAKCSYIGVTSSCMIDEVEPCMKVDFTKLRRYFEDQAIERIGVPFSIYHKWDLVKERGEYTLGFPVTGAPASLAPGFIKGEIPGGTVFSIRHTGPYHHLANAWSAAYMRINGKQFRPKKNCHPFETYESYSDEVPETELVTTIRFPVA